MAAELVHVEVCYAGLERQFRRALTMPAGSTVLQAVSHSGVLAEFPEIDLSEQPVGLYGKKCTLETVLREHDRIELYRPLRADPKESRRKKALKTAP